MIDLARRIGFVPWPALIVLICVVLPLRFSLIMAGAEAGGATPADPEIGSRPHRRDDTSFNLAGNLAGLSQGREDLTDYAGPADLVQSLTEHRAPALSMAAADLDEDGVPDLIIGYAGADSGIIGLLRGNIDAIYPNSPEARQRKASGTFTEEPFLSPAQVSAVPQQPDFIGAGDFDGDGHYDVVIAARGGNRLSLLSGDGQGNLVSTRNIHLRGGISTMTVGDFNLSDGVNDLVVGVQGEAGPEVLIFDDPRGALTTSPEIIGVSAPAYTLALGDLDGDSRSDLAIAAGNELMIVHGRNRHRDVDRTEPAVISRRPIPFIAASMTLGEFKGTQGSQLALLSQDGSLYLLDNDQNGDSESPTAGPRKKALSRWRLEKLTEGAWPQSSGLVRARVAGSRGEDLIVLDPLQRQAQIIESRHTGSLADDMTPSVRALDLDAEPVAILPMRLNSFALDSLVILKRGDNRPAFSMPQAQAIFTVTNTNRRGPGSLAQAFLDANAAPGPKIIKFNIGTGKQTIDLRVPEGEPPVSLPPLEMTVVDGTTQPGFQGTPIIELINGEIDPQGRFFDGLITLEGGSTLRGLVINRCQNGIVADRGKNIIEGNFIGTDITGTKALGNEPEQAGNSAVRIGGGLVGGTTPQARNLISGNKGSGVYVLSNGEVKGNYIGTDIDGTNPLPNQGSGVQSGGGGIPGGTASGVIGGPEAGAGNLISANWRGGIELTRAYAARIQGNMIGLDKTGMRALGNGFGDPLRQGFNKCGDAGGIEIRGGASHLIGGNSGGARNIVSGNGCSGIYVSEGPDPIPGSGGTLSSRETVSARTPTENAPSAIFSMA